MNQQELTILIEKAQTGDQVAKNSIIRHMQNNGYMRAVSRYIHANRLLEPDDARSEFWLGVIIALPKVNPALGDPLFYLAWRGANRVKSQLRQKISKGVELQCNTCGWTGRLFRKDKSYECKECGSKDINTWQREINETTVFRGIDRDDIIRKKTEIKKEGTILKLDLELFKSHLSPQESRVFSLIVENEIDRFHEKNYIKSISIQLDITPQCVNHYLRKIKIKYQRLFGTPYLQKNAEKR